MLSRRRLLRDVYALGAVLGGASLVAACEAATTRPVTPAPTQVLPPPETTSLRWFSAGCDPWGWMCEPYLREEGFIDFVYPARSDVHLQSAYAHETVTAADAGLPTQVVAGLHTGCVQVWARPGLGTLADLRGKTIVVGRKFFTSRELTAPHIDYGFWVSLLAHIGMQATDVTFIERGTNNVSFREFLKGAGDACLTIAAQGPQMRLDPSNTARKLLDTTFDKPWSQQLCCVLTARTDWAKSNPTALRRATRAILRTIDDLAKDRSSVGRIAMEKGVYKDAPEVTASILAEVNEHAHFDWRDLEPEETLRYYALRLADGKLIKRGPQQVIAEITDLAWFRQLRKDLKP